MIKLNVFLVENLNFFLQLLHRASVLVRGLKIYTVVLEGIQHCFQQNCRQKVFNRGLCVCVGGCLTFLKWTKTQLIYSVSCFNLGGLGGLFGGLSSQKPPVATGLVCKIFVLIILFLNVTISAIYCNLLR